MISEKRIQITTNPMSKSVTFDYTERLCNLLNEQQAIIERQEQSITILKQEIADAQVILEMLSEKLRGWNNE